MLQDNIISMSNVIYHALFCKEVPKDSRLIQQVWPNWESAWFSDHKCITLSIFNILIGYFHYGFLSSSTTTSLHMTRSNCARKIIKSWKGFQVILTLSELGFADFQGPYLAHFLIFFIYSKAMIFFKESLKIYLQKSKFKFEWKITNGW